MTLGVAQLRILPIGVAVGKISAFSLVELMVAVGIVGVLVTLAVPRYHQFMVQARRGEAKSNLSHIATLQETYKVDHFSYYSGAAMSGTNGVGYRDGSGYDGSCDDPATDVDEGINNHLGFRPNGCGQLRYFYQLRNSGNTAVASAASDAKGRHIYPDCSGGGAAECGYVSGDAVRLAMSSGKSEVCRNITNYCPGSSTTPTPPPTPCQCCPDAKLTEYNNCSLPDQWTGCACVASSACTCTPSSADPLGLSAWTPDPATSWLCEKITQSRSQYEVCTPASSSCYSRYVPVPDRDVCGTKVMTCMNTCGSWTISLGTCMERYGGVWKRNQTRTRTCGNNTCTVGEAPCPSFPARTCTTTENLLPVTCTGVPRCDALGEFTGIDTFNAGLTCSGGGGSFNAVASAQGLGTRECTCKETCSSDSQHGASGLVAAAQLSCAVPANAFTKEAITGRTYEFKCRCDAMCLSGYKANSRASEAKHTCGNDQTDIDPCTNTPLLKRVFSRNSTLCACRQTHLSKYKYCVTSVVSAALKSTLALTATGNKLAKCYKGMDKLGNSSCDTGTLADRKTCYRGTLDAATTGAGLPCRLRELLDSRNYGSTLCGGINFKSELDTIKDDMSASTAPSACAITTTDQIQIQDTLASP